jgi:uncharacterized protein (TIGR00251 family)
MIFIREHPEGIVFKIFVQPRSSVNKIVGIHGDALKLKITAAPVAGAANKMCIKFLAKCLKESPVSLEIISGHNSRIKQVLLRSGRADQTGTSKSKPERLKHRIEKLINN